MAGFVIYECTDQENQCYCLKCSATARKPGNNRKRTIRTNDATAVG